MQMLSYANIEEIANKTLNQYLGNECRRFKPINIQGLITDYLGLSLEYKKLSKNGSILGVTTFADVSISALLTNELIGKVGIKLKIGPPLA